MPARISRAIAVSATVLALGAVAAPTASAQETRPFGNGSVGFCFVVPFAGSANVVWCL